MKKILISFFALLFTGSVASAAVNVGVSMSAAGFTATGTETESDEKNQESAAGTAAYGSIFIEKTLGDRLTIGLDYVPATLDSETAENVQDDVKAKADGAGSQVTNTVKASFENLTTIYLNLNMTENLYLKAGMASVDVITGESLATGSKYGDGDMDGTVVGLGYSNDFGNSMFIRFEGTYMDLGSLSLTSSTNSDNKVSIDDLNGVSGTIKIGKSF
tara:strand:- start:93 stop:743 length:651 start_codon:yes stop_codon:yes gene_type:complete